MLGLRVKLLAALLISYGRWQGFQTACWNFKGSLRCELFDSHCKEKFKNPCRTGQSKPAETVQTCVSWEAELGVGTTKMTHNLQSMTVSAETLAERIITIECENRTLSKKGMID